MRPLPRLRANDYHSINDALHEALNILDDFRWGTWWLRCIEFHFGKGNYTDRDQFGWHVHKEFQIEVPVRGRFAFRVKGGKTFEIEPGMALAIPPGSVHRWNSHAPGVMIGISMAVVPRASSLQRPINEGLSARALTPPSLELVIDGLLSEFLTPPPTNDFSIKRRANWMFLIVTRILGEIELASPPVKQPLPDSEPSFRRERVVSKIIRYIDANIDGELTMEHLEAVVGLSSRQIHRLFVEVTGSSCHSYIMDRRLETARSKLQGDPTLSIKEIAYASGFASPAHFSAKFKKCFGVPPTEYR